MTAEEWEQESGGFVTRQLNDTRYASKLARAYLGLLYGGFWDAEGRQRVFAVTGQVTSIIRDMWDMNAILGDGGIKERIDHRHHAVDSVAIALTTPTLVQQLANHAVPWYERRRHRSRFRQLSAPWDSFHDELQKAVEKIIVSHRVQHRVNRALHDESNYSAVPHGKSSVFRIRRLLHRLKPSEVERIADPRVKAAVQAKLNELGIADPAKAFADPARCPVLVSRAGHKTPIHAVRISVNEKPIVIGTQYPKYCVTGSNHHLEVLGVLDKDRHVVKWDAKVVSTYEAMQRVRKQLPVVQQDHGSDKVLLFTISPGDTIRLGNPGAWPEFLRVRTVSQSQAGSIEVAGVGLTDARRKEAIKKAKQWYRISSMSTLQKLCPSKVNVLPDGTIQARNNHG
jgi:CRISPR-associated endonuclease Csn1